MNEWVRGKDENLWIYWMSYRDKDLIREWVSEWVSEWVRGNINNDRGNE